MAITLGDLTTHARSLLREPTTDSVSTVQMEDFAVAAYLDWCQELQWPEGTFEDVTAAGQQEYALPDSLNVLLRVYVNGQRANPSSIPLLEGEATGRYDPRWRSLPSVSIPALDWTGAGSSAIPITAGPTGLSANLVYYMRGGFLGLYPKPAGIYPLVLEGAIFPTTPITATELVLPAQFKDGLAYGAIKRFLLSDRRIEEAKVYSNETNTGLEDTEYAKAQRWVRRLRSTDHVPPVTPHNYRTFYGRSR